MSVSSPELRPTEAIDVLYLQMTERAALCAKACPDPTAFEIREAKEPLPELNRFLYTAVGGDWYWVDRLPWSYAQWQAAIAGPNHRTFVCYANGTPAGYYELHKHDDGSVEIAYFGLIPAYLGRGVGGWLLSRCISDAWDWSATRVFVHTCTLDHPAALNNYQARGLVHYHTEIEYRQLPVQPPGAWPGAQRPRLA